MQYQMLIFRRGLPLPEIVKLLQAWPSSRRRDRLQLKLGSAYKCKDCGVVVCWRRHLCFRLRGFAPARRPRAEHFQ